MTARTLKNVLALHRDRNVQIGTAATTLAAADWDNPHSVKVLVDKEGYSLYFSRAALPFYRDGRPRTPPPTPLLLKHLGVYSYRADALRRFIRWPAGTFETAEKLEQLRALENGVRLKVAFTPDDSVGVDRPADVARVERALAGDKRRNHGRG